jgi:hypothetical protein
MHTCFYGSKKIWQPLEFWRCQVSLTLPSNIRIPSELYEKLRDISISLAGEYQSSAPSIQDVANVALKRFLHEWEAEGDLARKAIVAELLESRRLSRSKMGPSSNKRKLSG